MPPLAQQKSEFIVDVFTLFSLGTYRYSEHATEQALSEAQKIRKRTQELKKQGMPGIEAVRQAKVEWLVRITTE